MAENQRTVEIALTLSQSSAVCRAAHGRLSAPFSRLRSDDLKVHSLWAAAFLVRLNFEADAIDRPYFFVPALKQAPDRGPYSRLALMHPIDLLQPPQHDLRFRHAIPPSAIRVAISLLASNQQNRKAKAAEIAADK